MRQQSEETQRLIKFEGNENLMIDEFIQTLNAGPKRERKCTDLPWCIFFFIFCCGLIVISKRSGSHNIARKLSYAYDSDCEIC
jgi:hypothetical protein